jgi:hypothetical protein
MNAHEKVLLARLEVMPLEDARIAIHTLTLGNQIGSPNHDFCLSWLALKDSAKRDASEKKQWWVRPPGLIAITIISNLLTAAVFYLLGRS